MPDIVFNGPEGRLEGRYHHSKKPGSPIALVLHFDPQHGGTMNNKIVYAIYQVFVKQGFSALRFNFRGVGRSQGVFDGGMGELSDAASGLDWVQAHNPNAPACWVAGYSFGSWIGMQLMMRRPEIGGFVSVAPPANRYDFNFLAPCPASGLIVHGERDDVVPKYDVDKLAQKLNAQKNIDVAYETILDADHFFGDHDETLATVIGGYLETASGAKTRGVSG